MKTVLVAGLLLPLLLFGCILPPAPSPTPSPTSAAGTVTTTVSAPTPAASSNFSNELKALAEATADMKIIYGEMLDSFEKINNDKANLAAYSSHLQSLDAEANETVFLKKNAEILQHLLSSNEYYLGALNTGRIRTSENFTCNETKAYELTLSFLSNSVNEGMAAVDSLHSLAKEYPQLAYEAGSQVAGDLVKAYYDGMAESISETRTFLKTRCG
ncbi:MAG: hypothetical protein NTY90_02700 [Candidatus Micrarchaeota archaeon]|nr:hypothetical protein [Candidatus Micrarchaeota archaeon]